MSKPARIIKYKAGEEISGMKRHNVDSRTYEVLYEERPALYCEISDDSIPSFL